MPGTNMNMEDPKVQEDIRRKSHEYVPTAGKHGMYVERPYKHQEYPKMMGNYPRPQMAAFKGKPDAQQQYEAAMREWDAAMSASIVHSAADEKSWLKANA